MRSCSYAQSMITDADYSDVSCRSDSVQGAPRRSSYRAQAAGGLGYRGNGRGRGAPMPMAYGYGGYGAYDAYGYGAYGYGAYYPPRGMYMRGAGRGPRGRGGRFPGRGRGGYMQGMPAGQPGESSGLQVRGCQSRRQVPCSTPCRTQCVIRVHIL